MRPLTTAAGDRAHAGCAQPLRFAGAVVACAFAAAPALTQAEVFRCTTPEGATLYSDAPCPRGAKSANISTQVGECDSEACLAQREERATAARRRLSEEKATLAALTEQRLRAEALELEARIRQQELRRMAGAEEDMAAAARLSDRWWLQAPLYPWWPAARPCRHCGQLRPAGAHDRGRPSERPLSLRDFGPTPARPR